MSLSKNDFYKYLAGKSGVELKSSPQKAKEINTKSYSGMYGLGGNTADSGKNTPGYVGNVGAYDSLINSNGTNSESTGTSGGNTSVPENNAGNDYDSLIGSSDTNTEKKPTPFEDYISSEENRINEYYDFLKGTAEDTKADAYEQAEKNYQHAAIDANAAYQRNLATYGQQAEALGKMGLSGSGYSDYLKGNAYSQLRTDRNTAMSEKNEAISSADKNYYDSLINAEQIKSDSNATLNKDKFGYYEQLKSNQAKFFSEILSSAGSYTLDQIKGLAEKNGFTISSEDEGWISAAIDAAKSKEIDGKAAVVLGNILSTEGGINSFEYGTLKNYLESNGLSIEEGEIGDRILSEHHSYDGKWSNVALPDVNTIEGEGKATAETANKYIIDIKKMTATGGTHKDLARGQSNLQTVTDLKTELQKEGLSEQYNELFERHTYGRGNSKNSPAEDIITITGANGRLVDEDEITVTINGNKFELVADKNNPITAENNNALRKELNRIAGMKDNIELENSVGPYTHTLMSHDGSDKYYEAMAKYTVVAYGEMYIPTDMGWVRLRSNNEEGGSVDEAVKAYIKTCSDRS